MTRRGLVRLALAAALALVVALVVAAVVAVRYGGETVETLRAALGLAETTAGPAEHVFELRIEEGAVADEMELIRVAQGDLVTLRWRADETLVLHLHGYDIEKEVRPGVVTEFVFTAYATGRFPVAVHGREGLDAAAHDEAPLVTLEVYPR